MSNLLNNSQVRIVLEIFRNPGVNLRGIIAKTKLSPNYASKYLNHLVERGIVKEEKLEKKRVYLRRFFLNFDLDFTRNFFKLIKEEEKESFFLKYQKLKPVFEQLAREIKSDFILVYGSYARLQATEKSDIDVLVVGKIRNKEKIREIMVSLDMDVSLKIETFSDFEKRIGDALHQQIFKEGIIIFDNGKYLDFVFRGVR